MAILTDRSTVREGGGLPVQALQSGQITLRSTGWMGVSLLAQLRTRQYRYRILIVSPPNSHSTQLHFNLTDATHWMNHYNGFSYEEFYEFIIDFFEADATPVGQEAATKLLEWWNKYISNSILTPATTDTTYSQSSFPEV